MAQYCIITTAKQPLAQTLAYVHYHLNTGADHLVLFLDDPDDAAKEALAGESRVTCVACDAAHWTRLLDRQPRDMPEKQHTNLREGARVARSLGYDWAISLDADELLYSAEDISAQLAALPEDIALLKVPPMEAVHAPDDSEDVYFAATHYKVLPSRWNAWVGKAIFRRLKDLTREGFFGHTQGKAFFRLDAPIDVYRQHRPRNSEKELPMAQTREIYVLHHDSMSFESWKRKWHRRIFGDTRATAISEGRKRQHEEIKAAMSRDDDRALRRLFERWHALSRAQLWLLRLSGLVRRLEIDRNLFQPPASRGGQRLDSRDSL